MVKKPVKPEVVLDRHVALALSFVGGEPRNVLTSLFALDAVLGGVLRTSREPLLGQMRLVWWHDALERLDREPPPAEPVLQALATDALPAGVRGSQLARMTDGWEALLAPTLDDDALATYALERGGELFAIAARCLTSREPEAAMATAGEAWALVDLAANTEDAELAARAWRLARPRLVIVSAHHWGREARALGSLVLLAASEPSGAGGLRRLMQLIRYRFTGRWSGSFS